MTGNEINHQQPKTSPRLVNASKTSSGLVRTAALDSGNESREVRSASNKKESAL